jgi:hypothetical protein
MTATEMASMAVLKITSICQSCQYDSVARVRHQRDDKALTLVSLKKDQEPTVTHSGTIPSVALLTSIRAPALVDHAVFAAGSYSNRPVCQRWTAELVALGWRVQSLLQTSRRRNLSAFLDDWSGKAWISKKTEAVKLRLMKHGIGCITLTFCSDHARFSVDAHPESLQASPDHSTVGSALQVFKSELNLLLNALLSANPKVSNSADGVRISIGSVHDSRVPMHDLVSTLSVLSVSSPIDAPVRAIPRKTIGHLNSGQWSEHIDELLQLSRDESLRPYLAAQTRLLEVLGFKFLSGRGSRVCASFDTRHLTTKIGKWPDGNRRGRGRPFSRKAQIYNKSAHISRYPDSPKSIWWAERYAALGWPKAGVEFIRFDAETGKQWFKHRDVQQLHHLNHVPTLEVALAVLDHLRSKLPKSWNKLHQRLYGESMPSSAGATELRRERRRKIALDLVELHKTAMALFSAFAKAAGVSVPDQSQTIQHAVQRWRAMKTAPTLQDLLDMIKTIEHRFRMAIAQALRALGIDEVGTDGAAGALAARNSRIARRGHKQRDTVKVDPIEEVQVENERPQPSPVEPTTPASLEAKPPQGLTLVAAVRKSDRAMGQEESEEPVWLTTREVERTLGVSKYLLREMEKDGLLSPVTTVRFKNGRKVQRYRKSDVEAHQRAMDLL